MGKKSNGQPKEKRSKAKRGGKKSAPVVKDLGFEEQLKAAMDPTAQRESIEAMQQAVPCKEKFGVTEIPAGKENLRVYNVVFSDVGEYDVDNICPLMAIVTAVKLGGGTPLDAFYRYYRALRGVDSSVTGEEYHQQILAEHLQMDRDGKLTWETIIADLASLGNESVVDGEKRIGMQGSRLMEIANLFGLNVVTTEEYARMIDLSVANGEKFSEVKMKGAKIPFPQMHAIVMHQFNVSEGHCVLVTNRSISNAYCKTLKKAIRADDFEKLYPVYVPKKQKGLDRVAESIAMRYGFGRRSAFEKFSTQLRSLEEVRAKGILSALNSGKLPVRASTVEGMRLEVDAAIASFHGAKYGLGRLGKAAQSLRDQGSTHLVPAVSLTHAQLMVQKHKNLFKDIFRLSAQPKRTCEQTVYFGANHSISSAQKIALCFPDYDMTATDDMAIALNVHSPSQARPHKDYEGHSRYKTLQCETTNKACLAGRHIVARPEKGISKMLPERALACVPDLIAKVKDKSQHVDKNGGHPECRLFTDAMAADALNNILAMVRGRCGQVVPALAADCAPIEAAEHAEITMNQSENCMLAGVCAVVDTGGKYGRNRGLFENYFKMQLLPDAPLLPCIKSMCTLSTHKSYQSVLANPPERPCTSYTIATRFCRAWMFLIEVVQPQAIRAGIAALSRFDTRGMANPIVQMLEMQQAATNAYAETLIERMALLDVMFGNFTDLDPEGVAAAQLKSHVDLSVDNASIRHVLLRTMCNDMLDITVDELRDNFPAQAMRVLQTHLLPSQGLFFVHSRPNDVGCTVGLDSGYNDQSMPEFLKQNWLNNHSKWQPGAPIQIVRQETLESVVINLIRVEGIQPTRIHSVMIDTAYYFQHLLCPESVDPYVSDIAGEHDRRVKSDASFYAWRKSNPVIAGALTSYFPVPGRYKLPHNNGHYEVNPDQTVSVRPNGVSAVYVGANMFIGRCLKYISYPWMRTSSFCGRMDSLGFVVPLQIQNQFMRGWENWSVQKIVLNAGGRKINNALKDEKFSEIAKYEAVPSLESMRDTLAKAMSKAFDCSRRHRKTEDPRISEVRGIFGEDWEEFAKLISSLSGLFENSQYLTTQRTGWFRKTREFTMSHKAHRECHQQDMRCSKVLFHGANKPSKKKKAEQTAPPRLREEPGRVMDQLELSAHDTGDRKNDAEAPPALIKLGQVYRAGGKDALMEAVTSMVKGDKKRRLTKAQMTAPPEYEETPCTLLHKPVAENRVEQLNVNTFPYEEDRKALLLAQAFTEAKVKEGVTYCVNPRPFDPYLYVAGHTFQQSSTVMTGVQLERDGKEAGAAVFDHRSLENQMVSIQRQTCIAVDSDPVHLERFARMMDRALDYIQPRFEAAVDKMDLSQICGIKHARNFPSPGKRLKYAKKWVETLFSDNLLVDETVGMKVMVKSSECHILDGDETITEDLHLLNADCRPRCICIPPEATARMICQVQTSCWWPVKESCKGFIQAMDKKTMTKRFLKELKHFGTDKPVCLCADGSGFDSTQNAQNMRIVDNAVVERLYRPLWRKVISEWLFLIGGEMEQSDRVNKLLESACKFAKNTESYLYAPFPGYNEDLNIRWTEDQRRIWNRDICPRGGQDVDNPEKDWLCIRLSGTVLSGNPYKTTNGNTFRQLAYNWYYLEAAGIKDPWVEGNGQCYVACAGDDTIIFVRNQQTANRVKRAMESLTAEKKQVWEDKEKGIARGIGLGQILKKDPKTGEKIKMGGVRDIEFLSTQAFSRSNTTEDLIIVRDVTKVLKNKMYYSGQNRLILDNPVIHRMAILDSFRSEGLSKLIEAALLLMAANQPKPEDLSCYTRLRNELEMWQYRERDHKGYEYEDMINEAVGFGIGDLYRVAAANVYCYGSNDDFGNREVSMADLLRGGNQPPNDQQNQQTPPTTTTTHNPPTSTMARKTNIKSQHKKLQWAKAASNLKKVERAVAHEAAAKHSAHHQGRVNTALAPMAMRSDIVHRPNTKEIFSAWDMFQAAKNRPGCDNVRYVSTNTISPLPTMTYQVGNSVSKAYRPGAGYVPGSEVEVNLGSTAYTLFLYCPSLSARTGGTQQGDISYMERLSGFSVLAFDENEYDQPAINRSIFNNQFASYTMADLYGSTLQGFSAGGFVFAGEIENKIVAPRANLTGAMYKGSITYGQLPNSDNGQASQTVSGISLRQLVQIAKRVDVSESFLLRSSVINNDLVNSARDPELNADVQRSDYYGGDLERDLGAEVVHYVILQQPVMALTAPSDPNGDYNFKFTLIQSLRGNVVFWPEAEDSMANNLFQGTQHRLMAHPGYQHSHRPIMLQDAQNMLHHEVKSNNLWDMMKKMASSVWNNGGSSLLGSTLSSAVPALAGLLLGAKSLEPHTTTAIVADYNYALRNLLTWLRRAQAQDSTTDWTKAIELCKSTQQLLHEQKTRVAHLPLAPPNPVVAPKRRLATAKAPGGKGDDDTDDDIDDYPRPSTTKGDGPKRRATRTRGDDDDSDDDYPVPVKRRAARTKGDDDDTNNDPKSRADPKATAIPDDHTQSESDDGVSYNDPIHMRMDAASERLNRNPQSAKTVPSAPRSAREH